jgi:hypothetical protein
VAGEADGGWQMAGPGEDGGQFLPAARVSGIRDDGEDTAWGEEREQVLQGGQSGGGAGGDGVIGAGEVAEIKDDGLQLGDTVVGQRFFHGFVSAGMKMQRGFGGGQRQPALMGGGERCGLHIAGVNNAFGAQQPGQKHSVVTTAGGGIDPDPSRAHPGAHIFMSGSDSGSHRPKMFTKVVFGKLSSGLLEGFPERFPACGCEGMSVASR